MNDVGTFYLTQGVLGVTVLVLGGVCWKLYNKIQELQDARVVDAKETAEKVTAVLAANTQSNLLLAEKIEAAKRSGL